MENKTIADHFKLLADLMKLKGESKFKIRSYDNAYNSLRKYPADLCGMDKDTLMKIDGVGKAIAEKITTLCVEGRLSQIEQLRDEIPIGVQDMLNIRGLGTSKIEYLWRENDILSVQELKEKCLDRSILKLKGFGEKSRVKLLNEINFYLENNEKMLFAEAYKLHLLLSEQFKGLAGEICLSGDMRRTMPTISEITWVVVEPREGFYEKLEDLGTVSERGDYLEVNLTQASVLLQLFIADINKKDELLYESTGGELLQKLNLTWQGSEESSFAQARLPYIAPEMRDLSPEEIKLCESHDKLIETRDIKGVVHAHTDWSDGMNTIEEMVQAARDAGYSYLTITDHSKAAFYAHGLSEERIDLQCDIIGKINAEMEDFTVLTGVECDILSDGTMDLSNECLSQLDVVIASVHSNLSMEKEKATDRLLAAIENPYVNILGHLSGRLLLSRKGYELDYEKIIEACKRNKVAIEVNANPKRLDIDWKYIPACLKNKVPLCINPDAHNVSQIEYIKYGVIASRKGGLGAHNCLNTMEVKDFLEAIH